ncbi:hypothetical protein Tco_1534813, partial [Tanacetum coccineum]
ITVNRRWPPLIAAVDHRWPPPPLTAAIDRRYEEGSGSTRAVRRLVDRDLLQLTTMEHALG